MSYRIATDIGGTFTDLTLAVDGALCGRYKAPTTPGRYQDGVLECIALAAQALALTPAALLARTSTFVHGSTVATNAVLEGKVAKTGVVCTRGTRYTLWRGEGRRRDIFDFSRGPRAPLVPPHRCVEVSERIDRDGKVLVPLDLDEAATALAALRAQDCTAVAVCLLWSVRNDSHERALAALIARIWPEAVVSLSSEVQPILREYTRMSATALNAMLKPVVAAYLEDLSGTLRAHGFTGEVLVVASDGGVQPVAEIAQRPVNMLFSGPATGPFAARHFAAEEAARNALLIDMGGTSFDVSTVVDGAITITRDGRIDDRPTGVAAVEILTLGAGGGSLARVDAGGLLQVGPDSAGAQPGPACYGRGGSRPTVTDAYLVLGYLSPSRFLGGRMSLSRLAAERAIDTHIAGPLGITREAAALGICRVINERMLNGILEMTVRRGIDPRELVLVTGGGATGVAAAALARELGIARVIVPRETSVLCAFGALGADLRWSTSASCPTTTANFDFARVQATLARLAERGTAFLDRVQAAPGRRRLELHAAARYPMQVTEIEVPCPGLDVTQADVASIAQACHAAYHARYTVSEPDSPVEFVSWRLCANGIQDAITRPCAPNASSGDAVVGEACFHDGERMCHAPEIDLDALAPGATIAGPALMVARDTTVILPSAARARVGSSGQLVIDLENSKAAN
jgi:N-methylhydantoinase A